MQKRPPSVLILNRVFPPYPGATGRMACDLALYLRRQGCRITVVTSAPEAKTETAKNLTVVRVNGDRKPDGARAYFAILRRMERAARKLPPHDVVISMTDPPLLARTGQKIARKMRARHIHWAQDLYPDLFNVIGVDMPRMAYRYCEKIMHNAMKSADSIVTISGCMARTLTHRSIPRAKISVIENWPERELAGKTEPDDTDGPSAPVFAGEEAKFRILYAGNIGLAHTFDTVLKAAERLQAPNPEIEFVFAGTGRGVNMLARARAGKGFENVRFLPPQPPRLIRSLMEGGDVHLVTIKDTASGLLLPCKFYSACAVGRPVLYIGPEDTDIDLIIRKTGCGVSIRNGDVKGAINAILTYRQNAEAWFRAAEAASHLAAGAPEKSLRQWERLITGRA